ncbi:hypothetical protein HXX76_008497 [Chlamydomonas incerta]|uniref:Uncharacterized protein n=1 Tax=Chlamydomonas incerta TaxID=51695 RepID=A0A835T6L8_CHLIN|nr:hypothetical protein HXX76_008497 [Chlamydomonas incerta]|eukprot:KAG2433440.1 hypothetical protein HXX76_008497 [Chlamydomonas incerta]
MTVYMNYTSSAANLTLASCTVAARSSNPAPAYVALAVVNNDPLTSRYMCIGLQLSSVATKLPTLDACANNGKRNCTAGAGDLPKQQVPCNGGAKKALEVLAVYDLAALGKGF